MDMMIKRKIPRETLPGRLMPRVQTEISYYDSNKKLV
jgi:hypothetical protein